jgi:hypothetical protein
MCWSIKKPQYSFEEREVSLTPPQNFKIPPDKEEDINTHMRPIDEEKVCENCANNPAPERSSVRNVFSDPKIAVMWLKVARRFFFVLILFTLYLLFMYVAIDEGPREAIDYLFHELIDPIKVIFSRGTHFLSSCLTCFF